MSKILIGVTGGIATYKTAALVSQLVQADHDIQVVMTRAAEKFIGQATFSALTGKPVAMKTFHPNHPLGAHIELARDYDLLCVAPATANFMAKAVHGIADDLLSTLYLCFMGPVILAPAMNNEMWIKPSVQRNEKQLKADGVHLVGPEEGWLSCRVRGVGRMSEPDAIRAAIEDALKKK